MYMPLSDAGSEAYRPVEVKPLTGGGYLIEGPMPADEKWAYAPGTVVKVKWKRFVDGEHKLVPTGPATAAAELADHAKRMLALSVVGAVILLTIAWLPRGADGLIEPLPLFLMGIGLAVVAVAGMIWLKPRSYVMKWTLWLALSFGALFSLVTLPFIFR